MSISYNHYGDRSMIERTRVWSVLSLTAMVLATAFAAVEVSAQKPRSAAERRQHPGQGFWANDRAARRLTHARDYSTGIGSYATRAQIVQPAVTKSESEEVGRNLAAAGRELRVVRKAVADDKAAIATIDSLSKQLAVAEKQFELMNAECCKASVDGQATSKCCADLSSTLDEIIEEHAALMKSLYGADHAEHDRKNK